MVKATSKGEKKAYKLFEKLGLKPMTHITRVTIKRPKNIMISINRPQVYATTDGSSYIVIGEPRFDDIGKSQQAQLAQLLQQTQQMSMQNPPKIQEDEPEEPPMDASGLDDKDIELVQSQANVSRNKAIKALKEHDNDVVNAIMELTM
eukprot:NODE_765_length_4070_cov_0.612692.p4 type:complete len:148 gc:universal NODE_765_length_4070_cov_0.612692:3346-2903(-)